METAVELFKKYALDDGSEFSRKEIIRYMSEPGQAASYMMGRLEFVKARELVERELKDHFDIKDFHYQVKRKFLLSNVLLLLNIILEEESRELFIFNTRLFCKMIRLGCKVEGLLSQMMNFILSHVNNVIRLESGVLK